MYFMRDAPVREKAGSDCTELAVALYREAPMAKTPEPSPVSSGRRLDLVAPLMDVTPPSSVPARVASGPL
jgi:hypothetical protein